MSSVPVHYHLNWFGSDSLKVELVCFLPLIFSGQLVDIWMSLKSAWLRLIVNWVRLVLVFKLVRKSSAPVQRHLNHLWYRFNVIPVGVILASKLFVPCHFQLNIIWSRIGSGSMLLESHRFSFSSYWKWFGFSLDKATEDELMCTSDLRSYLYGSVALKVPPCP